MRLICNGEALDLASETRLAIKKLNPLFAFDKLTCERTTEIALPATATNDRVFMLAKLPAYTGEGMRRKFPAQLQEGTCTKDGYLYVSSYKNETYKAIFVTGELVGLQDINNAGSLSEIIQGPETVELRYPAAPLPAHETEIWGLVAYYNPNIVHPSMRVKDIVDRVVQQKGLHPIIIPESARKLRIIPGEPSLLKSTQSALIRRKVADYVVATQAAPVVNSMQMDGGQSDISGLFGTSEIEGVYSIFQDGIQQLTLHGRVIMLTCKQGIKITFPSDWDERLYIGRFISSAYFENAFEFYGDRSFIKNRQGATINVTRIGEPLAGRSVELPFGTPFIVISEDDYFVYDSVTTTGAQGWRVNTNLSVSFVVEGSGEAALNETLRLQDNLPDVTFVDLLKTIAAATNTVLNYTDADGITFDPVTIGGWQMVDLSKLLQNMQEVARTFGDYAQRNIVRYNSDETLLEAEHIEAEYTIDNDNLASVVDLQVIPFSEGSQYVNKGYNVIGVEQGNKTDTLADANSPAEYMARVELGVNSGVQSLCTASTKTVASFRLSLNQYDSIAPKTKILVRGTEYVWVESNWQNDIATFTLAKI